MSLAEGTSVRMASSLAVIFDMDGVLVDSVRLNWQAINEVLATYDVQVSDSQIKNYLGLTLKDQVARFNDDFGLELEYGVFEAATNKIKERLFATLNPKDGVSELLRALKVAHVPLAVGTSMPRGLTEDRLSRAGIVQFFDALITEEDVAHHKPAPDVYLAAADALGMSASSCVVFEDAPAGVQAAKSANMKCVAIVTPYVPVDELNAADLRVASPAAVTVTQLQELVGKK